MCQNHWREIEKEVKHVKKALTADRYKKWMFEFHKKVGKEEAIPPKIGQLLKRSLLCNIPDITGITGISEQLQMMFGSHGVPPQNLSTLLGPCW